MKHSHRKSQICSCLGGHFGLPQADIDDSCICGKALNLMVAVGIVSLLVYYPRQNMCAEAARNSPARMKDSVPKALRTLV